MKINEISNDKSQAVSMDSFLQAWATADVVRRTAALSALRGVEKAPANGPGRALTMTAAAKRAGVSRQTIYRALSVGVLRAIPLFHGGRPRITEAELDDWLAKRGTL
jgi:excisionase family DNA binding protein